MSFLRRLFGKREKAAVRDEDRFAQRVMVALKKRDTAINVEYNPDKFELIHVDDCAKGQRTFLHNSFAEYRRLPLDDKEVHLNRVIAFIIESRKPMAQGDAALDKLLPVLRPRADTLAIVSAAPEFSYSRSSRPFCDSMLLMLALDSEASIALVNDEKLDELGISFDDALGIAVAQLDEKGAHTYAQLEAGIFVSASGDSYDSSRMLLPEMFLKLPLKGNPVAIVQSRSSVLVTGSEDVIGLEKIAGIALAEISETERAVSLTPVELYNGVWRVFDILPHHPLALRNLLPNQLCWSFGATKAALQEKLGDDIFVANAMLVEKDGAAVTLAVWGVDVVTACPDVDALAIQEDGEFPQIIRKLEDVMQVCGQFSIIDAMPYPKRYYLPARMTSAQRAELTQAFPEFEFDRN